MTSCHLSGLRKIIKSYLIAVLWRWKVLQIKALLGGEVMLTEVGTWFLQSFSLSTPIPVEGCRKMHVNCLLLEELLFINKVIGRIST